MTLNANSVRELLAYDQETGVFMWKATRHRPNVAGKFAGTVNHHGYRVISIGLRKYQAHRLAWLYAYGVWPASEIDHINGVRTDNRIKNLRDASPTINMQNKRKASKNNKAGMLGVRKNGGSFTAQIGVQGRQVYLGSFATPEHAQQAYISAKRDLHQGWSEERQ